MQLLNHKKLHVVAGRATQELAADICNELEVRMGTPNIAEFANGEIHVKYGESIRGSDVFIVQTHTEWDGRSINDQIMEHLIMVDAAKRASAKRITAVAPFYGYSRQDRKASGREPITARLLANMFADHTVVLVWLGLVPIGIPALFMNPGGDFVPPLSFDHR